MQRTTCAVFVSLGFFSLLFRAEAQLQPTAANHTKTAGSSQSSMEMGMPSVAPLFLEGVGFSSVLNLVNELDTPLRANVEIYSLDGEKVLSTGIPMAPYSLQRLGVQALLRSARVDLEIGSIRVGSDHTAGLLAALSFTQMGAALTYFDEELMMPSMDSSNVYRGVADDVAGSSPITAITSLSGSNQNVTTTCLPEKGERQQRTFLLGPNQTVLTRPCSVRLNEDQPILSISELEHEQPIENKTDTRSGTGIAVSSDGMPGEFAVYGITPHRDNNNLFFTSVNFSDPKMRHGNGSAYVGIPVGPSPLLPEGNYSPEVAITNFGLKAATVTLKSVATVAGTPKRTTLASFVLGGSATRTIQLNHMPPSIDLTNSLLIQTDASPGEVMSKLVSHGHSHSHISVEMVEKDDENRENAGGHPWNIASEVTSTLLLFNHDPASQRVTVRFGTPNGPWMKRFTLNSMETLSISINELIETRAKDDSGRTLALNETSGEVGWQADSSLVTGRMLEASRSLDMARNFSCNQYVYACAFYLSPNPSFLLYLNNTGNLSQAPSYATYTGFHPPTSCSCANPTGSSLSLHDSWTSGNSSIALITSGGTSSTSTWKGAGGGSTTSYFAGTTQFSGGGSLTCQASEPTNTCNVTPAPAGGFTGGCDGSPHGHLFSFTLTPAGSCVVSQVQGKTTCTGKVTQNGPIIDSTTCSAGSTGNAIDGTVTYSTTTDGQIQITANATVNGTTVTTNYKFAVSCP